MLGIGCFLTFPVGRDAVILADTSIWIAMFRTGAYKVQLNKLIEND